MGVGFGQPRKEGLPTKPCNASAVSALFLRPGWHVELGGGGGDSQPTSIRPDVLVSLTTPKLCACGFQGQHYIGGRFIPPEFARQFGLALPEYAGDDQVVLLPGKEE